MIDFNLTNTQNIKVTSWTKIAQVGQSYLISVNSASKLKLQRTNIDLSASQDNMGHVVDANEQVSSALLEATEDIWVRSANDIPVEISVTLN